MQKINFYSTDLQDALSLAHASIEEGPLILLGRADFHAADIAQYNKKHSAIKKLKKLKISALNYLKEQRTVLNYIEKEQE